ncbi:MAG: hypothetical protein K8F25_11055 [Fimbriimonadaceae bacterium]|nr:hypothetical protein [Alphaproteobacteria bacterium]
MKYVCRAIMGMAAGMLGFAVAGVQAGEFAARHGMNSGQYQGAFDQYVAQGFQLAEVDGYATPGGMRYAAIWTRGGGARWVARHGMSANAYQSFFDQYTSQGYQPLDISASGLGNNDGNFAAVWGTGGAAWVARHGLDAAQYQAAFDQFTGQNYRLVDVEGYTGNGGKVLYAALWVQQGGPDWRARHGLTSAQYQAAFDQAVDDGYTLTHVDGYWTPSGVRYAAIWERRNSSAWVARHGMTSAQYQQAFDKYVGQGLNLVHVSGYWNGQQEEYAAIWSR